MLHVSLNLECLVVVVFNSIMLPSSMRLVALVAALLALVAEARVKIDPSKHDVVKVMWGGRVRTLCSGVFVQC